MDFPSGRTKDLVAALKEHKLNIHSLLVPAAIPMSLDRASRNIPGLKVSLAKDLTVYDVLRCKCVVLSYDTLKQLDALYSPRSPRGHKPHPIPATILYAMTEEEIEKKEIA